MFLHVCGTKRDGGRNKRGGGGKKSKTTDGSNNPLHFFASDVTEATARTVYVKSLKLDDERTENSTKRFVNDCEKGNVAQMGADDAFQHF